MTRSSFRVVLLGYTSTNPIHTNYWPWGMFAKVLKDLGYTVEWKELEDCRRGQGHPRIFICWNKPNAQDIIEAGVYQPGDVILQKVTSLGRGDDGVSWGDDPLGFFKTWTWPTYQMVERLLDGGKNIYAFGCRTNVDLFPEKKRICKKLGKRLFWIPWGSSLFTWNEIVNAAPKMGGLAYDVCFVGSVWGQEGRGNIGSFFNYVRPLLRGSLYLLAGRGTARGVVSNQEHKQMLQMSTLCPIINAPSWRAERGVQDRFWSVFTAGRFGVVDSEGVYEFFDEKDVVCETDPGEYIEKSRFFLENPAAQVPYIEKIQKRIKEEYNYYHTWANIIDTIIRREGSGR